MPKALLRKGDSRGLPRPGKGIRDTLLEGVDDEAEHHVEARRLRGLASPAKRDALHVRIPDRLEDFGDVRVKGERIGAALLGNATG